jgi:hypothetical protein
LYAPSLSLSSAARKSSQSGQHQCTLVISSLSPKLAHAQWTLESHRKPDTWTERHGHNFPLGNSISPSATLLKTQSGSVFATWKMARPRHTISQSITCYHLISTDPRLIHLAHGLPHVLLTSSPSRFVSCRVVSSYSPSYPFACSSLAWAI